jgi:murein DD-endopeptidase MepM/ murein hydrolase activator NlpD
MAKISSSSLLGNLQSQSIKTLGLAKQIDSRTDRNVRRASLMNDSLDQTESEVLAEEAKISPSAMMGESATATPTPENAKGMYIQGFSDAMTSLTKKLSAQKEDQQTDQQGQPGAPGGSPGGGAATAGLAAAAVGAGAAGAVLTSSGTYYNPLPGGSFKGGAGQVFGASRAGRPAGHLGVDITETNWKPGSDPRIPVVAVRGGTAISDRYDNSGGYYSGLMIQQDDGYTTRYLHMMPSVKPGDKIAAGQTIGRLLPLEKTRVAMPGSDTHLHFELYKGNQLLDPTSYIKQIQSGKPISAETANVKPAAPTPSTGLQPPPKPQAQPPASSPGTSQGAQSSRKISSSQPTYSGGSGSSPSTTTAAFLQGLS